MSTKIDSRLCQSTRCGQSETGSGGQPECAELASAVGNIGSGAIMQTAVKMDAEQPKYICGKCGVANELQAEDPIKCKYCGYRVFYKQRRRRLIRLLAR